MPSRRRRRSPCTTSAAGCVATPAGLPRHRLPRPLLPADRATALAGEFRLDRASTTAATATRRSRGVADRLGALRRRRGGDGDVAVAELGRPFRVRSLDGRRLPADGGAPRPVAVHPPRAVRADRVPAGDSRPADGAPSPLVEGARRRRSTFAIVRGRDRQLRRQAAAQLRSRPRRSTRTCATASPRTPTARCTSSAARRPRRARSPAAAPHHTWDVLPEIRLPVLVVAGPWSDSQPSECGARSVAAALRHATFIERTDLDHFGPMTHPVGRGRDVVRARAILAKRLSAPDRPAPETASPLDSRAGARRPAGRRLGCIGRGRRFPVGMAQLPRTPSLR